MNASARKILIGLITNTEFIKQYIEKFPNGLFRGDIGSGIVERWCLNYYNKYKTAVGRNIQHAYIKAVENKSLDKAELEFIELLLPSISKESDTEAVSTEFLIDEALEYANKRGLENLKANLDYALTNGKVEDALAAYEKFKKVEKGEELPVISLYDTEKVSELTMKKSAEPLLHTMTHDAFLEEVFSQIVPTEYTIYRGRSKSAKSFGGYAIAIQALIQKKNVAIFSLGDLNESMSMKRLVGLLLHKPTLMKQANKTVRKPHIDCYKNEYNECVNIERECFVPYKNAQGEINSEYKPCTKCKGKCAFPVCVTHTFEDSGDMVTENDIKVVIETIKKHLGENIFDLYSFSAQEKSVGEISDIIEKNYYSKGKTIDLVVIDYWAQLKSEKGTERLALWEKAAQQAVALKNLCLKFNTSVLILDQSTLRNQEGSSEELINISNYTASQDKDCYCSSLITTNMQHDDKKNGTLKIKVLFNRYGTGDTVGDGYVLVCNSLSTGEYASDSIYVDSEMIKEIEEFESAHGIVKKKKK